VTTLVVGAERETLKVWIEGESVSGHQEYEQIAKDRNDHQILAEFINKHQVQWSDIDKLVLLQVPHSKTTVRVAATLLATTGWLYDHEVHVVDIDSIDDPNVEDIIDGLPKGESSFDQKVLNSII